ncbi:MAG: DUF2884 family protein [Candidatus Latescibacteria bacterium]|nr:DUF2884 family protein [bacterium]MBD3424348.1 DUF2884 family protein [Candidatus Latescibacterota bacterium]
MRAFIILLGLATLIAAPAQEAEAGFLDDRICDEIDGDNLTRGKNVDLEFDEDSIIFRERDSGEKVEITDKYELFIEGKNIPLKRSDRRLVRAYYSQFEKVMEEAREIGLEGARVGADGVRIAIKALGKALADLSDDDGMEKLEKEMDRMEKDIEKKAEKLERRAGEIEEEADELQDLHDELRESIRELDQLGWF